MKILNLLYVIILSFLFACKGEQKETKSIAVENFFKNPERSLVLISPDGKHVSFVQNYKSRANILCQDLESGIVTQLTFDTIRGISNYMWVNAEQLIYLYDVDGKENYHLFSIKSDGSQKIDLSPFDNVKLKLFDTKAINREEIYIYLNKRKAEVFDLYRLNINTAKLVMVDENPGNISYWKADLNGDIRLAVSTDGVNEKILFKKDVNSKYKEVISLNFKETLYPISFTADGNSIYALSNLNRDKIAFVKFDLITAKETEVIYQQDEVDLNEVYFSNNCNEPLFLNYRKNKSRTYYLKKSLESIDRAVGSLNKETSYTIINYTEDDGKFLLKLFSDRNIGTYYIFDVERDELKIFGKSSPWLDENDLAKTNAIEFTSRDGLKINAYLTLPIQHQQKYPLIVIAHSALWQRARWGYNPEVQFFANRGYAVLTVNHRGVSGFGKTFFEAGFKEVGRKMQDDYTDAVYNLIKKGIVDTARIGIYGYSFGGYFALNGLVRDSGLYKCAASYSGITNLFSYIKETPPYYKQYLAMIYEMIGNPEKDVESLREYSPAFHTDKMNVPIFIAHGEKDQRISVSEINLFVKTLKAVFN